MNREKDKLTGEEIKAQKNGKGIYRVNSRIWIPNVVELKHEILQEAYNSRFSIHPGSMKMYQDLKESYWWPNMKKEIVEWINGQSERIIQTIEDILRTCAIDFKGNWDDHLPLIEFSYNNSYHASIGIPPYEALYGRKYRPPTYWDEVGEHKLIGPDLVQQMKEKVEMIRKRLIAAQDRQAKYINQERKDVQFEFRENVLLKISPWKGLTRFGKKGKLSPRYIGPFEVLRRDGKVAYELALLP
ncbi:hypothetical protein AgCh_034054 [Apium graveolens]